jgi:hypothetical protein
MSVTINGSGQLIVQVVQANYSTVVSTTGSSYTATGLTATITPTSASNKILVLVNQNAYVVSRADGSIKLQLLRNGSNIALLVGNAGYTGNGTFANYGATSSIGFLDSPATTSAVTYSTQYGGNGSGTVSFQADSSTSTITLLEISG